MPDFILVLFYLVFLSQIFLLSFYYPQKFYQRMRYVTENFPPSKYPKLYPKLTKKYTAAYADEAVRAGPDKYRRINLFILLVGLILIAVALITGFSLQGKGEDIILVFYTALQFSPIILLEISDYKRMNLMRKTNQDSTRKADLMPRRFFDFVSPITFGLAVFLVVVYMSYLLYINDFEVSWDNGVLIMLVTIIGVHVYFAALIKWQVFGKKMDPHLANKDRLPHMKTIVSTSVYTSIAMSVFFMALALMDEFDMHYVQALLLSLYFQVIAIFGIGTLLRSSKIEDIDFEVYRKDPTVA